MQSQVLVPMIFTSVPGPMPAPTAPMWASKAPTATGTPAGRPTSWAHVGRSPPTARCAGSARSAERSRTRERPGESALRNDALGRPFHRGWYIALWPAAQMLRAMRPGSAVPVMSAGR